MSRATDGFSATTTMLTPGSLAHGDAGRGPPVAGPSPPRAPRRRSGRHLRPRPQGAAREGREGEARVAAKPRPDRPIRPGTDKAAANPAQAPAVFLRMPSAQP